MHNNSNPFPLKCYGVNSFASMTLHYRFPEILETAASELKKHDKYPAALAVLDSIQKGSQIDTSFLATPTAFWGNYIKRIYGQQWDSLSFLDVEFLFYHSLNSLVNHFESNIDIFYKTRLKATKDGISWFVRAYESISSEGVERKLENLIRFSVLGNQADYSQLGDVKERNISSDTTFLTNDTTSLINCMENISGTFHIVADNAGLELFWDLALIDYILNNINQPVVIHVKPWPMFVSDALKVDVEQTIDFMLHCESTAVTALANRLKVAIKDHRLNVESAYDWGEPRSFDYLNLELLKKLRSAAIVLLKGDLNYRRLIGDLSWEPDTPVNIASLSPELNVYAARILKSDAVVGITKTTVTTLFEEIPDWRSNGKFAVVQKMGCFDSDVWRRVAVTGSFRESENEDYYFRGGIEDFQRQSFNIGRELARAGFGFSITWSEKNLDSQTGKKVDGHPFWETADYHALRGYLSVPLFHMYGAIEIAISGTENLNDVVPFPTESVPAGIECVDLQSHLSSGVIKKLLRGKQFLRSELLLDQAKRVQAFIVMGGGKATTLAQERALKRGVIIPIDCFGGAGAEIFKEMSQKFQRLWRQYFEADNGRDLGKTIVSNLDDLIEIEASSSSDISNVFNEHEHGANILPWTGQIDHSKFIYNGEELNNDVENSVKKLVEEYGVCILRLRSAAKMETLPGLGQEDTGDILSRSVSEWFTNNPRCDQSVEHKTKSGRFKIIESKDDADANAGNTPKDLPMHNDGTHTYEPPSLIILQYFNTGIAGGALELLDMAYILKRFLIEFPEHSYDMLRNLEISDAVQVSKRMPDGSVQISKCACLFDGHVPEIMGIRGRFDKGVKPSKSAAAAFFTLRHLVRRAETLRIQPQKHDLVILDNWRVLHGRKAYMTGVEPRKHRRIWVGELRDDVRRHIKLGLRPTRWPKSKTIAP